MCRHIFLLAIQEVEKQTTRKRGTVFVLLEEVRRREVKVSVIFADGPQLSLSVKKNAESGIDLARLSRARVHEVDKIVLDVMQSPEVDLPDPITQV
jgi:hypothetical protein